MMVPLSLIEKSKLVLKEKIKNVTPLLTESLLVEINKTDINNNLIDIEKFLRAKLNLKKCGRQKKSKFYWMMRGWNEDESYAKAKENTIKTGTSVYSKDFWLKKINPVTGKNYTEKEAVYETSVRRPIKKEYWMEKGFNELDAVQKAVDAKFNNNKKGAEKNKSSTVHRVKSKRCIEYYLAKGYNEEESRELLSKSQRFFSKEICIEKHGEGKGLAIWQDRQDRWQATLNSKSDEEKARINRLRIAKGGCISKGEKLLFEKLLEFNIECHSQHVLQNDKKSHYIYDIVYNKKIIEYNGDFWHANPKKYKADDIVSLPNKKISARQIWERDDHKFQFARTCGYEILVVWESDFKTQQSEVIKKCIQFMTQ